MWRYSETFNVEKPLEAEINHNSVFVRRNFERVEAIDRNGEMRYKWVYEEAELSLSEYTLYQDQKKQDNAIDELTIAILED